MLEASAPILFDLGVAFKGPATLDELRKLNSGIWYGYSQVGKFITVYPKSTSQFIGLCHRLDRSCSEIGCGPSVPFDNRLRANSNVFYRYGIFNQQAGAAVTESIVSPSGECFEEDRYKPARAPSWERDPFETEAFYGRVRNREGSFLGRRYNIFRCLSQRGKGGVYDAIEMGIHPPRACVIKEGRKDGEVAWSGSDGFERTENEARILTHSLSQSGAVPSVYDTFAVGDSFFLVLEKLDGISLARLLTQKHVTIFMSDRLSICRELIDLVSAIHNSGIVWRDCTLSNVLIDKDGKLRALDFEGSCEIDKFDSFAWSTPDFSPPEIFSGFYTRPRGSNLPEDLFALGCCLYLIIEGRHPFPDRDFTLTPRMKQRVDRRVRSAILALLNNDPDRRPLSAEIRKTFT